jgi:hypothetical protein
MPGGQPRMGWWSDGVVAEKRIARRFSVVYTLRFMTHAEYSKDRWKDTL